MVTDRALPQDTGVHATPAGMALLDHASEVVVLEGARDVHAGARVAGDLQEHRVTEQYMSPRDDRRPVQTLHRDVLADGSGHDVVALGAQARDRLHRVEAHGPLRPAEELHVPMRVAVQPEGYDAHFAHRRLRDAAARNTDLDDFPAHWSTSALAIERRTSTRASADHPLNTGLQHELAALVQDTVVVRDDTAVGLLRLALVRHLDLDGERVALEHRRRHPDLAAEIGHARAVDQPGLHDQPFGEGKRQGAGRRATLEQRLPRDVLHVHE